MTKQNSGAANSKKNRLENLIKTRKGDAVYKPIVRPCDKTIKELFSRTASTLFHLYFNFLVM